MGSNVALSEKIDAVIEQLKLVNEKLAALLLLLGEDK